MKLLLLLATATCFSAATVSASKNDSLSEDSGANSHLRGGDKLAFPIILADVTADEGGSEKPDYCNDATDYDCYKKGVPKCCIKKKKECPDNPPSCDISGNVGPNESCSKDRGDVCYNGYACIDGTCQVRTKRPNESCKANKDTCTSGYACVDGTCQSASAKVVGQGDVCRRIDLCVSGTVCIRGRCNVPPIGPDGYCTPDDVCVNNYSCTNGKCKYTGGAGDRIAAGGYCYEDDVCVSGYSCTNGRCALSRIARNIPRDGACIAGVDTCADEYVCLDGKCGTAQWYTNWSYCIMDCPTSAGPCCGGSAQSWDDVYSSADQCCSQSALAYKKDDCVSQSLSCASISRTPRNGACVAGVDTCADGYVCLDGRCGKEQEYCFDNDDYTCYKKGVPKCCSKNSKCPNNKPACDLNNQGTGKAAIGPGERCNVKYSGDVCISGYVCNRGTCQRVRAAPIPAGGTCTNGIDTCANGYTCSGGRCETATIPYGGVCQFGDRCSSGYTCVNGRCGLPPLQPGQRCSSGDICTDGYQCQNGRCGNSGGTIPYNGDCTNNRSGCAWPNTCSPSQLNGSDRWNCQPSISDDA